MSLLMRKWIYLTFILSFFSTAFINIRVLEQNFSVYRITSVITIGLLMYYFLKQTVLNISTRIILRKKKDRIFDYYLFWLAYGLISVIWVKNIQDWARALVFVTNGILSIIAVNIFFNDKKGFFLLIKTAVIIFAIMNIVGHFEIMTGNYYFLDGDSNIYDYFKFGNPVAWAGNTNDYATIMLFSIFFLYISFANSKNKLWRVFCGVCISSSAYLCVQTGSRACIIGLLIGSIAYLVLNVRQRLLRTTLLTIAVIISFAILFRQVNDAVIQLAGVSINLNAEGGSDYIRMNLIKNGFAFLRSTYGFGVGAGNIEYWMTNYWIFPTGGKSNMHNWWMEILVGYGIIVFAGYLWIYMKMVITFLKAIISAKDAFTKTVSLGMFCLLLSFFIGSMSTSHLTGREWFWTLWGVVILSYRLLKGDAYAQKLEVPE